MADFLKAQAHTQANEGGYANNPADAGGETYKGIARNMHPGWGGWLLIDRVKAHMTNPPEYGGATWWRWVKYLNTALVADATIQKNVTVFYMLEFWDANLLGQINSQQVAEWAYDHLVNAGARGAIWLQLAAGVKPDGDIGPKTIAAVNAAEPVCLLERCSDIAGAYRLDKAAKKPSQIQFLSDWLERDGQPGSIIAQVKKAAADGVLDAREVETLKAAMAATA